MAEDFVIGGRGNMEGASALNGGLWNDVDAATYLTMQNSSGGPTADMWSEEQTICTVTNNGSGYCRVTVAEGEAEQFASVTVGTYANVDFAGVYADGRYRVSAVIDGGDHIDLELLYTSDTTCDIKVGGALSIDDEGLQIAFDLATASDVIRLASDPASSTEYLVDVMIDIDTNSGDYVLPISVLGVAKETGVELTYAQQRPKIKAAAVIAANSKISNNVDFWHFAHIIFDGQGIAANSFKIDTSNERNHTFRNCRFTDADGTGFDNVGYYCVMARCEFDNNDTYGCYAGPINTIMGCTSHDNGSHGFLNAGYLVYYLNNISFGNAGVGFYIANDNSVFINNLAEGNSLHGFYITSGSQGGVLAGNKSCNHTVSGKLGYFIQSGATFDLFAHNLSYGNNGGHMTDYLTDEAFASAYQGGNRYGNPNFLDPDNHDYTPGDGSDSIGGGYPAYYPIDGVPQGLQNFATIGPVTREEPAGGMTLGAFDHPWR